MKIALIFPRYKYPSGDAPLGVSYLASSLRAAGIRGVEIIDTTFDAGRADAAERSASEKFDIVGFSVMTTMLNDALRIASQIKRSSPGTRILFGGPHPTAMPAETLSDPNVDAVCIGEGERTIVEIVRKGSFDGVGGIWFKDGSGAVKKNAPREPVPDLDTLPFPALDLLPMDRYVSNWFQMDSVSGNLRGVNIISSRGCPYMCTYCQPTLFKLFGRTVRKRSPENIVAELERWRRNYRINAFMFQDDTLVFDRKWISAVCEWMIDRKLGLVWGCNARANLVDEGLFSLMKDAGLRKVFMGIESASQRVLDDIYDKRIKTGDVMKSVETLKKLGLKVQGYFMLGAPGETEDEVNETIRFAVDLPIDEATFSITTPLPSTYLYDRTLGSIKKDVAEFDYYRTPVYADGIDEKTLVRLKKKAILKFYLSRKRIARTAAGFLTPQALGKSLKKLKRF